MEEITSVPITVLLSVHLDVPEPKLECGQKYDLTKERIRQIKERAIKRLQKARYSSALKAYLG